MLLSRVRSSRNDKGHVKKQVYEKIIAGIWAGELSGDRTVPDVVLLQVEMISDWPVKPKHRAEATEKSKNPPA